MVAKLLAVLIKPIGTLNNKVSTESYSERHAWCSAPEKGIRIEYQLMVLSDTQLPAAYLHF